MGSHLVPFAPANGGFPEDSVITTDIPELRRRKVFPRGQKHPNLGIRHSLPRNRSVRLLTPSETYPSLSANISRAFQLGITLPVGGPRTVCVCVCMCDTEIIQSKLKLRASTFLLPIDHQRNHEFQVQGASLASLQLDSDSQLLIHSYGCRSGLKRPEEACVCV